MVRSAAQWLHYWATVDPEAPAMVIAGRRIYSFGILAAQVAQMLERLSCLGVRAGDLVGIECADQHLHLVTVLAGETLGAATVSFSSDDVRRGDIVLDRCQWLLSETAPKVKALAANRIALNHRFAHDVFSLAVSETDIAGLSRSLDPAATLRIERSSGTTGERKVLGKSLAMLVSFLDRRIELFQMGSRDRAIVCLYTMPTSLVYIDFFLSIRNGSAFCLVGIDAFDKVVDALAAFHVVVIQGQLPTLIAKYDRAFQYAAQRSLHVIGAEVPARMWAELKPKRFGWAFNGYGPSEVAGLSYSSMGAPYSLYDDSDCRIVDEDGRSVPLGTAGFIEVHTPRMIDGYLWNPTLTEKNFVDGWFRTYDWGMMPDARQVVILGRVDDMINIGGIKIGPGPYEQALRALSGVKDAILLGIFDQNGIEQLHVVIESDTLDLNDGLAAQIRATVAGTCNDCWMHITRAMPRTETGKVRRGELKEHYGRPLH